MSKPKIAIVRGKFLNKYEMQIFEPLVSKFDITAFGSLRPFHDKFTFPCVKLPSPMDLPEFPYKMPILNRVFIDAHYLFGLEERLRGFDIVHSAETYYRYTQQALNARKKGHVKKVVATVLENIPFNNEGIWGRKKFKKRSREELDHIIALTELTKKVLIKEGADPKKITVIGHGIDIEAFNPISNIQYQISNIKKINVLFAGRLEVYKGIYDVLETAKILLNDKDLKDYVITFTMVGDGSEKEKLLDVEKKWGIKKFVIHKEVSYGNMPFEYRNADIFVAPSKSTKTWQEQYCTTLLEAQASGLPIVTTESGGIPENVGNAAQLIPPGDFKLLAKALKSFILNPKLREEYAKRARKRAVIVHDSRIIAKKLSVLYTEVLSQ